MAAVGVKGLNNTLTCTCCRPRPNCVAWQKYRGYYCMLTGTL